MEILIMQYPHRETTRSLICVYETKQRQPELNSNVMLLLKQSLKNWGKRGKKKKKKKNSRNFF